LGRRVLAELWPGCPFDDPMMPDLAQEVSGQVRSAAQAVYDILMDEGFESENYIDIFDGGPVVQAHTAELTTVRCSQVATVRIGEPLPATGTWLMANERVREFRACLHPLQWAPGAPVVLDPMLAQLLKVTDGDSLRLIGGA